MTRDLIVGSFALSSRTKISILIEHHGGQSGELMSVYEHISKVHQALCFLKLKSFLNLKAFWCGAYCFFLNRRFYHVFVGDSESQRHSASRKGLECSVSSGREAKEILWIFHKARWVCVPSFIPHVRLCYGVWRRSGKSQLSVLGNSPHPSTMS